MEQGREAPCGRRGFGAHKWHRLVKLRGGDSRGGRSTGRGEANAAQGEDKREGRRGKQRVFCAVIMGSVPGLALSQGFPFPGSCQALRTLRLHLPGGSSLLELSVPGCPNLEVIPLPESPSPRGCKWDET